MTVERVFGRAVLNSSNIEFADGAIITEINGQDVRELENLESLLASLEPGAPIDIATTNGTVTGNLDEDGKIGVYLQPLAHYKNWGGRLFGFIARIIALSIQINLGVGLINLLPLSILDGGRMMAELSRKWYKVVSPIALVLLLANLFGPYVL